MTKINAHKICIIGVYFGTFPRYFPLWLKSCRTNGLIDFLVITDQKGYQDEGNVRFVYYSLAQMKEQLEQKLGFQVSLQKPHKCCDFKPTYGMLFADYLQDYDYWGHCDFDVIFGDLVPYFEKYNLYAYDKFLALGHLSLYRNNAENNSRFMDAGGLKDYRTVFTNGKGYAFDELPGMVRIYQSNSYPMFVKKVFIDISTSYKRYKINVWYTLDKKLKDYRYQTFVWENGKIYREYLADGKIEREEFMYIHFQKRPDYELTEGVSNSHAFYMTNSGFYQKNGETTKQIIQKLNPYYPAEEAKETVARYFRLCIQRLILEAARLKNSIRRIMKKK